MTTSRFDYYKQIADNLDFELSPYAEKIINRVDLNFGYCPCVSEAEREAHPENDYQCPCSLMVNDVKTKGQCHCRLFVQKTKK